MKAPTFSITAGNDTWPGRLRHMARLLNITVISSYRHSFAMLQAVVEDAVRSLSENELDNFDRVVFFYARHAEVLEAGMSAHRRRELADQLRYGLVGGAQLAQWVETMPVPLFVAVVEHARWHRAFPRDPYASGIETVDGYRASDEMFREMAY